MMTYEEKVQKSIEILQFFNKADDPYYLCYSGGKDSDVIRILADISGVNYEIHNNHTTVDAPETVFYIKEVFAKYGEMKFDKETKTRSYGDKAFIHYPKENMFQLILKAQIPPTRIARYCCAELKEGGGFGRRKVTGVRWEESINRKANQGLVTIIGKSKTTQKTAEEYNANFRLNDKRGVVLNLDNAQTREVIETCYRTTSTLINPIIEWTEEDVWRFLYSHGCESNPLYKKGFTRVGCVGCPMARPKNQKRDFELYPKYKEAYIRAFEAMLEKRKAEGKHIGEQWFSGEAVFKWWLGDDPNQMTIDDYLKTLEEEKETMRDYVPMEWLEEKQ